MPRIVHVVGTGTIGEPLVGLLAQHRKELGIEEVSFYKHSPRLADRPMIAHLVGKGAKLAVAKDKRADFEKIGIKPDLEFGDAIQRAQVVYDCTPGDAGLRASHYDRLNDGTRLFVAQGGEESPWGKPYALGINDAALTSEDRFVQVVSCNTHNICVLIKALAWEGGRSTLEDGRFVCIRRGSDVGEEKVPAAPTVDKHKAPLGTHHATDVAEVFKTLGVQLPIHSSALKINTQYMHTVWFGMRLNRVMTREQAIERFQREPYVSVTNKVSSNQVFQYAREHGPYGRWLAQTVVSLPSVTIRGDREVVGFSFTPQDGNALLSNLALAARQFDAAGWEKKIRSIADQHLVKEV